MQIFDHNKQRLTSGHANEKLRQRLETTALFLLGCERGGGNSNRLNIRELRLEAAALQDRKSLLHGARLRLGNQP